MENNQINACPSVNDPVYGPQHGFSLMHLAEKKIFKPTDTSINRLIYVTSGKIDASYADWEPIAVEAGEFVFIPLGQELRLKALEESHLVILASYITKAICTKIMERYAQMEQELAVLSDDDRELKLVEIGKDVPDLFQEYTFCSFKACSLLVNFYKSVTDYLTSGLQWELNMHRVKEQELSLLLAATRSEEELAAIFRPSIGVGSVLDFKDQAFLYVKEAATVSDMAEKMQMGLDNFKKVFKKHFDISPYQWMQQQKSQLILDALRDESMPLKQVVDEFKFSSQSHLNRFCEKWLNNTPKEIRDQSRSNPLKNAIVDMNNELNRAYHR